MSHLMGDIGPGGRTWKFQSAIKGINDKKPESNIALHTPMFDFFTRVGPRQKTHAVVLETHSDGTRTWSEISR